MKTNMKLETLNIWEGRVYQLLMEHVQKQAQTVDIFCFQEVYSTQSDHTFTRDITVPNTTDQSTTDLPARANIYQKLRQCLPKFQSYYYSSQDGFDIHGPVDYN